MGARTHLNTLFVTSDGAYVAKEGASLVVRRDEHPPFRVPIHMLESVVVMSRSSVSPAALGLCSKSAVAVSYMAPNGRFIARLEGPMSGNVLLRRAQFRCSEDAEARTRIARSIVAGKLYNTRVLLRRAARDHPQRSDPLSDTAESIGSCLKRLNGSDRVDAIRGIEGEGARRHFAAFPHLLHPERGFTFQGRNRRPARDPVNAMLSFGYAVLASDVRSACESTGLDPQVGFLHADRPGRASLALDLMEELRAVIVDRVVLSLVNRSQVSPTDFSTDEVGSCQLKEDARKTFLKEYQSRKSVEVRHPFTKESMTLGLVPLIQARLLAKHLRGEADTYPPYLWR